MSPLLAMLFPGMEWLPLIGVCLALIAFLGFASVAFVILRMVLRKRRAPLVFLSAVVGAAPVVGFIVWSTHFNSPLRLPRGASEVKISRAAPFALGIDDNLRFRLPEAEFRLWLESLCGHTWQSIQTNEAEMVFESFADGRYTSMMAGPDGRPLKGQEFTPPSRFGTPRWMETGALKSGYLIPSSRAFPGQMLYDADAKVVYYRFWH